MREEIGKREGTGETVVKKERRGSNSCKSACTRFGLIRPGDKRQQNGVTLGGTRCTVIPADVTFHLTYGNHVRPALVKDVELLWRSASFY